MYLPISDYAVIGDTRTAALVSNLGSVDWACLPHFDSAALFLRLLDSQKGGYCSVTPDGLASHRRCYVGTTAVLETTFQTSSGVMTLTDFMPVRTSSSLHPAAQELEGEEHRIVRIARCTEGTVRARVEVVPTPSFATEVPDVSKLRDNTIAFRGRTDVLLAEANVDWVMRGHAAVGEVNLRAGEVAAIILTHVSPTYDLDQLPASIPDVWLQETLSYWNNWSQQIRYEGEHREAVLRSAVTLKLLTYSPTGAIVAAPTTSLPEEIGGVRNWDYRYTWLRDSTFTLMALLDLGLYGEAHDYMHFLQKLCSQDCTKFRILYSIHGQIQGSEATLDHLDGYMGSKPVRVGNGAAHQKQLDVYGELMHAIYLYTKVGGWNRYNESFRDELWTTVRRVADYVAEHWREPDSGIWEVRAGELDFTHSKGLCYVALNCAVMLARDNNITHDGVRRWERERDEVLDSLLRHGFNPHVSAFTQSYGSTIVDAAILRLPMLGVIDANDPRMLSTVAEVGRQLVRNKLVYRYVERADGLPGGEATFAICTFWLVNHYVMQGRIAEAEELFQHVLRFGNDVGLFAEEIDPESGAQLGNFPQGFTHIGLINAAVRIAAAKRQHGAAAHEIVEAKKAG